MFNWTRREEPEKGMFIENLGNRDTERGLQARLEVLRDNIHSKESLPLTDNLRSSKIFSGLWKIEVK